MSHSLARTSLGALAVLAMVACEPGIVPPEAGFPAEIVLDPPTAMVEELATLQIQATLRDAAGNALSGHTIFWASEDPGIAEVNSAGVVRGVSSGQTRVAASVLGVSGLVSVTVLPPSVNSVQITPEHLDLLEGATATLEAIALDRTGRPLPGGPVEWASSNPGVASVDGEGSVRAHAEGATTITATSQGHTGTATVSVTRRAVATVEIFPSVATLVVGATQPFTAIPRDAEGLALEGREVFWSTTNPGVATVTEAGVVHAVAPGAATITALVEGRSASANVSVSVTPVSAVEVQPGAAEVVVGQTTQLEANAKAQDGSALPDRVVTWTSSDPTIASVDLGGVVTANAIGAATITAASEGRAGTAFIAVRPVPVATVEVYPPSLSLTVGASQGLSVVLRAQNGSEITGRPVAWASADVAVATVSSAGMVTAVAPGTTTVSATSEGQSGSATVTVTNVPVASVSVSPESASLTVGGTRQFTATTRAQDGTVLTGRTVTWSTGNASVATVNSSTGLVTAVAPGSTSVTASSEGQSGSATVTVTNVPVASVSVSPESASLTVGGTRQFTATTRAQDGTVLTGRTVTWSTGNASVATVNSSTGLVTAVAPGSTSVTATSEGQSGSASVTVVPVPVASVDVSPETATVTVGGTAQFTATPRDQAGTALTGRSISWTTGNPLIATVDAEGRVTGLAPGSTSVTATSEGQSGSATITVEAVPAIPAGIEIVSGPGQTVSNNEVVELVVRVIDALGNPIGGMTVLWSAEHGSIAPSSSTTGAGGTASAMWNVGPGAPGTRRASASVSGTPLTVEFSAERTQSD
jgi:trimeric autotransporter adhesin